MRNRNRLRIQLTNSIASMIYRPSMERYIKRLDCDYWSSTALCRLNDQTGWVSDAYGDMNEYIKSMTGAKYTKHDRYYDMTGVERIYLILILEQYLNDGGE